MICLENITWSAPGFALREVSFTVPQGCYGVLMGRTGCGKTSLLEVICGLRQASAGRVLLNQRDVTLLLPGQRGIGYVPQDGALFPTMTVRQQIGFGLRMRRERADVIDARVEELAREVAVAHLLERRPHGLSGGEKQRVALARALIVRPSVLLLDEPLASLDEETQGELMELLRRSQRAHGMTVLHVTHSRREAEALGDVRLRLVDGCVKQEGYPDQLLPRTP
ncbi:MAG: ABC transporter ATP-binding protein [Roseimicrobium sp.]